MRKIRNVFKPTSSNPCSCSEGRRCDGCKKKRVIKPQVYLEEPRRLTVPIVISRFRHKPVTTVEIANRQESSGPSNTLCGWYRRRKALKDLKKFEAREKRLEYERGKREREAEILGLLQEQELEKARYERDRQKKEYELVKERQRKEQEIERERQKIEIELEKERQRKEYEIEKARKEREAEVFESFRKQAEYEAKTARPVAFKEPKPKKERKSKVKPTPAITKRKIVDSRTVYATKKRRKVLDSIGHRFVNCCYKFCCQLYCWMTIILVLALFLILYL